jgi:hypothetical protein
MNSLTRAASREVRVQGRILGNGDGPTMLAESRHTYGAAGAQELRRCGLQTTLYPPNHLKKLVLLNDLED